MDAPEELRTSLGRVVAASDERRRRFERDLHDGVQQQLVALVVNLQLVRRLTDSDPAAAQSLLEEIGRDAKEALADVRRLAWRIYPALLPGRGLAEALREAASVAKAPARIEAAALERFPAEIESTVYFCCFEALENAQPGQQVTVRLAQQGEELVFDLIVDGADESWISRVGAAIADRLGVIGGKLTVASEPEGARFSAAVPAYSLSAR
jgi:signal transduction histidine kinase